VAAGTKIKIAKRIICHSSFFSGRALWVSRIEMDFEDATIIINDGQHRCGAIAYAIKENPELGVRQHEEAT
jgi:hypothetical protein